MPILISDRVKEQSTTSGTGNVTVTGAVAGFNSFHSAFGTGSGNTFCYAIEELTDLTLVPAGNWEVGQGYMSNNTNLVRSTVLDSSSGGSAVNFGGNTLNIFCSAPAPFIPLSGPTLTGDPYSYALPFSFFGSGADAQYNFSTQYDSTHTNSRTSVNISRLANGSGQGDSGAQDLALTAMIQKENYLTSSTNGVIGAAYFYAQQGANGDVAPIQAAGFKTLNASSGDGGITGAQIASVWNDSSGNVLQEFQTVLGWGVQVSGNPYPYGGVAISAESWGATVAESGSQVNGYALYYGGIYDAYNNAGESGTVPSVNNAIVFSGSRTTAHEYFKVVAGVNESGAITMGSGSATGIDGATATLSNGTRFTLQNTNGVFQFINSTGYPVFCINQNGYIATGASSVLGGGVASFHAGTNENLIIVTENSGPCLSSINDAGNAYEPITINGSSIYFSISGNDIWNIGSTNILSGNSTINPLSTSANTSGGNATPAMSFGTTGPGIFFGSGAPTISAKQGSLYVRTDGSNTTNRIYVNNNGSTGWASMTTST